jgi:hypothetical protein
MEGLMGKKQRNVMPPNRADFLSLGAHVVSQTFLVLANAFGNLAEFGQMSSQVIDRKKSVKMQRKELEDSVMYDLAHLEVTDG